MPPAGSVRTESSAAGGVEGFVWGSEIDFGSESLILEMECSPRRSPLLWACRPAAWTLLLPGSFVRGPYIHAMVMLGQWASTRTDCTSHIAFHSFTHLTIHRRSNACLSARKPCLCRWWKTKKSYLAQHGSLSAITT